MYWEATLKRKNGDVLTVKMCPYYGKIRFIAQAQKVTKGSDLFQA